MELELGIILPNSGPLASADAMYRIAERAEALGFAALWTADHLVVPVSSTASYPYVRGRDVRLDPGHGFIEPLIALAGIAARTTSIQLGVSVYLAALRHPIVAAKLAASLDQLSGGRLILGVGAGWIPEEYATMGIEWPDRGRVLDEHIECMRALWSQERPAHAGRYYQFGDLGFEPKPVERRVPIWIGGNSRPAMRRAARLGDGWHVIDLPIPELKSRLTELGQLCEQPGRKLTARTVSMRSQLAITDQYVPPDERVAPLTGPLDAVIADLCTLRDLGVGHIALWPVAHAGGDLDGYLASMQQIAEEIAPALQ